MIRKQKKRNSNVKRVSHNKQTTDRRTEQRTSKGTNKQQTTERIGQHQNSRKQIIERAIDYEASRSDSKQKERKQKEAELECQARESSSKLLSSRQIEYHAYFQEAKNIKQRINRGSSMTLSSKRDFSRFSTRGSSVPAPPQAAPRGRPPATFATDQARARPSALHRAAEPPPRGLRALAKKFDA